MVRIIPAHIEDGRIVPDGPLPEKDKVRSVSIHVELSGAMPRQDRGSTLPRLLGILKDVDNPKQEYVDYLERKYR